MKKISLLMLLLLSVIFTSCLHSYIERNKKVGNTIIEKIELYKNANGQPPNCMQSLGYEEYDFLGLHYDNSNYVVDTITSEISVIKVNEEIFCYERKDSVNYILWFGSTLGEGVYYYSDSKQWENKLRGITHNKN